MCFKGLSSAHLVAFLNSIQESLNYSERLLIQIHPVNMDGIKV